VEPYPAKAKPGEHTRVFLKSGATAFLPRKTSSSHHIVAVAALVGVLMSSVAVDRPAAMVEGFSTVPEGAVVVKIPASTRFTLKDTKRHLLLTAEMLAGDRTSELAEIARQESDAKSKQSALDSQSKAAQEEATAKKKQFEEARHLAGDVARVRDALNTAITRKTQAEFIVKHADPMLAIPVAMSAVSALGSLADNAKRMADSALLSASEKAGIGQRADQLRMFARQLSEAIDRRDPEGLKLAAAAERVGTEVVAAGSAPLVDRASPTRLKVEYEALEGKALSLRKEAVAASIAVQALFVKRAEIETPVGADGVKKSIVQVREPDEVSVATYRPF
jgi:hypothetical protein